MNNAEKAIKNSEKISEIFEFLEYMTHKGYSFVCHSVDRPSELVVQLESTIEKEVYAMFGIDVKDLEKERKVLLKSIQ